MANPINSIKLNWYGKRVRLDLFDSTDYKSLNPIRQVQAVSFVDKDHIVLYKSGRGNYGCPGGHPEDGETWEETLKREVREEVAAEIEECGPIGYIKEINLDTNEIKYFLRYWAKVKLLDEPIDDPCDDARIRVVCSLKEAVEKLNWGKNGEILVNLAKQNI